MKEFYCYECRRYKEIKLLGRNNKGRRLCISCCDKITKLTNITKGDKNTKKRINKVNKTLYIQGLSNTAIKAEELYTWG